MTKEFHLDVSLAEPDPEWDDFVAGCPDPHPEQTSLWGACNTLRGWQPVRLVARRDGRIVGGAQVLERRAGRLFKVGYLNRGPLMHGDDPPLRGALVAALKELSRTRGFAYLAVVLPYSGAALERELIAAGFVTKPDPLPPRTSFRSTLALDLSPELETILAQMRPNTRTYIRQGQKRGLRVREGTAADVETFSRLLSALCSRRGVTPNVPTGEFLQRLWEAFSPRGWIGLFLAERESEPVTARIVFALGPWVRAWRVGWTGEHPEARPNELINWETIKWAKSKGYRFFDFGGLETRVARALVANEAIPRDQMCGMSYFKLGFGGQVLLLHPTYCYFFNPIARVILRTVPWRLLEPGFLRGLLTRPDSREPEGSRQ